MKFSKAVIILSFLFIAMMCMSSVVAGDDNLTSDSYQPTLSADDNLEQLETINTNNTVLSSPKTIIVEEIEDNHNEMSQPTIQKAIDEANAGDTIIIEGKSYDHCHFIINKKLTIRSAFGTTMKVCPSNTGGSGYKGIFYVSPNAGGTIIEGFTLNNDVYNENDYGILVKGDNVEIRNCNVTHIGYSDAIRIENVKNCLIENVSASNANNAINIKNSQNTNVKSSNIKNSKNGITIVDSHSTTISDCSISNNNVAGVSFSGTGKYLTINYNNITENRNGIRLTSSDNVYILSNYIAFNTENGVYVDYNITKIEIKGNFFNQNYRWEVFNDFHVENINDISNRDANNLEIITNNYMINYGGYGTGDMDRPIWTQVYEYKPSIGDYNYDAVNDVYVYVGEGNGEYYGHQGIMYLGYVFEINEFVSCPNIYYSPQNVWIRSGNYELQLSEIKQVKKGIYTISIVDAEGNVAKDLSSVPVTFYLNKVGKSATPQEGDVYKAVMLENGTATVRFFMDEFSQSGNVITAVFPTPGTNIDDKVSKTLAIDDADVPGTPSNTTVSVSNMNTYPNSNQVFTATLKDINGKVISGETLTFTINSKTYNVKTDSNGQAKIKISESKEGNYVLTVRYAGDGGIDYYQSSAKANVVVKKANAKIISSNLNMIPKMAEYYSITLKDAQGNVLTNQKVTFKVNGKTYTKATNSKGVAKVKLKFNKNKKTYNVVISFKGNNQYKSVSKTNKLIVKYSSKKAKLTTPKITVPPKTAKYYTVSLKDVNGKAIAKQKVTVKINGKKYAKKTNSKGQIKIKVKFSKLKNYGVKATYKGSKIYKKASSSGNIKVAKTTTKITAPSISMLPKESKSYTVTLKAGSKSLSKQTLTIKVNGKTYTKTTDSKGQASVSVNFANENTFVVNVNYKGTGIYKASSASGKINVAKLSTDLTSYDKSYSKDSTPKYAITLKDASGNVLSNANVMFTFNGENYTKTTDANGKASLDLVNPGVGSFSIITTYLGSDKYKSVSKTNKITILDKTNTLFIDENLPNDEIQKILNTGISGENIEFLGNAYRDVNLIVKNGMDIYSLNNTTLYAKDNNPVFNIEANNVSLSGFSIMAKSNSAISLNNVKGVTIFNNSISNVLDDDKLPSYADATVNMPGYGIAISNSTDIRLFENDISLFESGIFAQYSSNLSIDTNRIRQNNYGIKYGYGIVNTRIINNEIFEQIGLYIMTVPEGPSGYGIFLNNSAVNVTINHNHIYNNHLGISLDTNYSTGIVITQNTITDSVLEGIRFNAGYDLAENAVEPHVTDNAIYRNARGPSMMILGELSANPFGIYGNGLYNPEDKLKLEPNWYGTNNLETWDNDTGVVGYGTMCPRINTTNIQFNMTRNSPCNYSIKFYKNGELASNLPVFDMFATLNRGTDKEVEVVFDVINGVGTFTFDSSNYNDVKNIIEISIGSLLNSTSRVFKVTYLYEEIPN
ncbi:Ig-like domain repeat protein [Methanobrevibacter sp.]|uniref:right-handed parallel beta-helix repeat-containing protein n=1 Tax=Methanobrevibacter sp. TaxID=66852 RepID=UPI0025E8043F|nr:Ig-like domain repeat protein [Methanobrevibacter sp.]MBQ2665165.1 right-handed parallel beta-helix repeat-containing protein [Methanobrevibacter sp.]